MSKPFEHQKLQSKKYGRTELKIRFITLEGLKTYNSWREFLKTQEIESMNSRAEELMIDAMKNDMKNIYVESLLSQEIENAFTKMQNKLQKAIKLDLRDLKFEFNKRLIPLDTKQNLLLNLLADKELIDSILLNIPDNDNLTQDPAFITTLRASLDSHFRNLKKEKLERLNEE